DGHFRGGRDGEVSYLVDGVQTGITLNVDAVQEIEVISGTFNAEYGKVMSGIVNTAPKTGGENYSTSFKLYTENFMTGHDYVGLDKADIFHKVEARLSFGGPVPFTNKKLYFFVFGNTIDDKGLYYGINRYISTDSSLVAPDIDENEWVDKHSGDNSEKPMSSLRSQNIMGNLSLQLSPSFKVGLLFQYENITKHTDYVNSYKYIPSRTNNSWGTKNSVTLSLANTISPTAFHEIKVLYFTENIQKSRFKDPLDSRFVNNALYNNDIGGFVTGGNDKSFEFSKDNRIQLKYDLLWQINHNHEIKFGIDYVKLKLNEEKYSIQNYYSFYETEKELTHYTPFIPDNSTAFYNHYEKHPEEVSVYLQDKSEFDDLVINYGLRYDFFDPKTIYPTDMRNPANSIATDRKSEYLDADPQTQLSPRFGLAYTLGETAALHFSYGHFFQTPNYSHMYTNPDYRILAKNYASIIGNPNMKSEKTVKYELGLQMQMIENLVLNTDLFYHDIYQLETIIPIETYDGINYGLYSNLDYASTRGMTIGLDYRKGTLNINTNYTLQFAEGNASQPRSNYSKAAGSIDPVTKFIPLDWDQRHTINLSVSYNTEKFGVSLIGRYGSGTRYTLAPPDKSSLALINIPENGWTKPATTYLDLRSFYKMNALAGAGFDLRIGLYIYNLLDTRNELSVYRDSGRANSTIQIEEDGPNYVSTFTDIYDLYNRPDYYSRPRSVKLEVSLYY
ncbi:MAG: TonB-dependent receptor, partial [Calditrichia bacterium]|nr:TonB-dependent receptor [Calditrichia bacterium]